MSAQFSYIYVNLIASAYVVYLYITLTIAWCAKYSRVYLSTIVAYSSYNAAHIRVASTQLCSAFHFKYCLIVVGNRHTHHTHHHHQAPASASRMLRCVHTTQNTSNTWTGKSKPKTHIFTCLRFNTIAHTHHTCSHTANFPFSFVSQFVCIRFSLQFECVSTTCINTIQYTTRYIKHSNWKSIYTHLDPPNRNNTPNIGFDDAAVYVSTNIVNIVDKFVIQYLCKQFSMPAAT